MIHIITGDINLKINEPLVRVREAGQLIFTLRFPYIFTRANILINTRGWGRATPTP